MRASCWPVSRRAESSPCTPVCVTRGAWPGSWRCRAICRLPRPWLQEAQPANRDVPIFMAHGRADPVIPYDLGKRSAKLLKAADYPVQWHGYAAEHTVCLEELHDIEAWLNKVLADVC
jgi:predicted esterase